MRALSGPGLVIYPLTGTFACVDWIMSLETDWFSTIFAVIVLIGQILAAFAFVVILLVFLRDQAPICDVVKTEHFHKLGNLLLTFVLFWTYVAFSQLLIIYSGNLPAEIQWYLHRIAGGWKYIVLFLVAFHFFIPFLLLLFRVSKRNPAFLVKLAAVLFFAHLVNTFWLIAPSFHPEGFSIHWLDFVAPIGIGGIWMAVFIAGLKAKALLPRHDPRLEYSLADAK